MKTYSPKSSINRRQAVRQLVLAGTGAAILNTATAISAVADTPVPPALVPFSLMPKAPLEPGPGGIDIRTWVRSGQTNMQFSCVETAVAPRRMGPAPHVHRDLDELMYVLEGKATVMVAGKVETIPAGGWHLRPRQIEHTFWNAENHRLRFIDMYFNQNFEDFLEELFHQIIPDMSRLHLTPADPRIAARIADLDKRFGITTFHEKRAALIEKYGLKG